MKTKYAKAAAAKERKANKAEGKGKVKEEKDEYDVLAEGEDVKKGGRLKQTKLDLKPMVEVEAKPKKNPWSDSADSDDGKRMFYVIPLTCILQTEIRQLPLYRERRSGEKLQKNKHIIW